MGPTPTSGDLVQVAIDARDAALLGEPVIGGKGVMSVVLSLHVDLFAGLAGKLFLGAMGLLLIASLISGAVLYAPFMRTLAFGDVRRERAARVEWLDLHNLIGIATLAWFFVVGATGMINTWAELLVDAWRNTAIAQMAATDRDPTSVERSSLEAAFREPLAAEVPSRVAFIAFPRTSFSSPHHYGIFLRGDAPSTSRLLRPVFVDTRTSRPAERLELPWYLSTLLISQPLHFGDYGGLPLKCLWAAFDIAAMVVLGSGLYLWFARRRPDRPAAAGTVVGGGRQGAR